MYGILDTERVNFGGTKMDAREEKGLVIAATSKIEKNKLGWKVPSQVGNGSYIVNLDHGYPFCTCPDFEKRRQPCKHIHAVEYVVQRETKPDGSETVTHSMKVTCTQEWSAYDEAQMHEQERFVGLLRDLCNGIQQPPQIFNNVIIFVNFYLTFDTYMLQYYRKEV